MEHIKKLIESGSSVDEILEYSSRSNLRPGSAVSEMDPDNNELIKLVKNMAKKSKPFLKKLYKELEELGKAAAYARDNR